MPRWQAGIDPAFYTGTSSCTSDAEGDTPQLTSEEACRKRDTQYSPAGAFVDPKPRFLGRDPVGGSGSYGLLQVGLTAPRAS